MHELDELDEQLMGADMCFVDRPRPRRAHDYLSASSITELSFGARSGHCWIRQRKLAGFGTPRSAE